MKRSSKIVLCLIGLLLIFKVVLDLINKEDVKEIIRKNILYEREYKITKLSPIEVTIQVNENYMPKDDKLLSYFNEPIEVKELVYEGNNSEIYLDRIEGNDNNFLRLCFEKRQNINKDKGKFLSIGTEEESSDKRCSFIYDHDKSVKVYDKDDKLIEDNALWLSDIRKSEDFKISIKKDILSKVKYPLTIKVSEFNIVKYEQTYQ
ncbi:hypothetical protein [Clostridium sp. Marseille-QA1073]